MSQLPLNSQIYHKYTKPAQEYFFPNVQNMKGQDAVGSIKNRGRVLLLVFPPPGDMAAEVVKQYGKFDGNDIVIYVGEGLNGANANQKFFDHMLNKDIDEHSSDDESNGEAKYKWCILETVEVEDLLGGGKGFEKMFIFKRIKV